MSSSTNQTSSDSKKQSTDDIEKLLNREASAFQREVEVERILKAFKLNAYDILDLDVAATPEDIKKKYRQLSLFIHPDKAQHARAPEAFDILKKAESELSDKNKREELDAIMNQARIEILKSYNLPTNLAHNDPSLRDIVEPSFRVRVRARAKDILIEEEVRRRKAIRLNLANEGLEARKKDEEVASRKRKVEEDKQWEENREQRVDSWRSFASNKDGRKKKKSKVIPIKFTHPSPTGTRTYSVVDSFCFLSNHGCINHSAGIYWFKDQVSNFARYDRAATSKTFVFSKVCCRHHLSTTDRVSACFPAYISLVSNLWVRSTSGTL
ncbi:hypothetical protein Agabi119p4_5730 [Agaricus bisporus var. burnettii]|uniref:J domain-containing protein n=1 Tax=Agaricus bisporus var. burnettii TaxID=192524 RepID=A0A8H7KGT9_AGABI|nr:hypothetical protein Agabi119p4_5730 [Agaricus bisporus var. burnettii]